MWDFLLVTFTSTLFVVDPLGVVPSYLVMTAADSAAKRRQMAFRAAVISTATLMAFASTGGAVLALFGVGLSAFRIAGGVILFLVAFDMLRAQRPTQERPDEVQEGVAKEDIAVTPLAIPMLAGPAAMCTVTMLMNLAETPLRVCALYAVILAVGLISYAALRLAEPLHHLLGRTGIHVISRILGLVVLAIGVQLVLDGLADVGLIKQTIAPLR